ncbi:DUF5642 family protein [Mycolicibacter sinensis]|uniref:DUF5642 family protein n=1 Tax=Mycolicibacter sinensis (strain JDM601) TaxID=875328 RepID=UPI001F175946|nr:DUF5642 family protein [Mycolicibacter sinensis]
MAPSPLLAPLVVVVVTAVEPEPDRGRRAVGRRGLAVVAALGAGAALAGCGPGAEPDSATPRPAAAEQAARYDISRVDAVKDDFPAGFTAAAHPAKTLGEQDIAGSGVAAFTDARVDPPQCRSVVIPRYADPTVGTQAAGVIAQGDQGNMYVVALRSPNPVAAGDDPAGCDRISLSGSPQATGTVERLPGPGIAGATTTGAKLTVEDPQEDPDYLYTAALDDRTSIVVMGSADAQLDPQRLMSDLLVKAVAAVRGQQQS